MKPTVVQVIGQELVVGWEDGHESYYGAEFLRKACPCANCAGEPDLFGRMSRGPQVPLRGDSFVMTTVERVGNYGLQPNWKDGHTFGIWTWESLRRLCPCDACSAARAADTPTTR